MRERERERVEQRARGAQYRGQFSLPLFHTNIRYYAYCFEWLALEHKVRTISLHTSALFVDTVCILCVFVVLMCACIAPCGHHRLLTVAVYDHVELPCGAKNSSTDRVCLCCVLLVL